MDAMFLPSLIARSRSFSEVGAFCETAPKWTMIATKYVDKKYKGEYPLEAIYFSLNTGCIDTKNLRMNGNKNFFLSPQRSPWISTSPYSSI